jgi:hypothetical protein
LENLKVTDHSEDLDIEGEGNIKIDLREIGLDLSGSGYGPVAGFCEHGNEPSGFIKGG